MMRSMFAGMLAVAVAMTVAGPAPAQTRPEIRIATAAPGGAFYVMGGALAEELHRSGKVTSATAEASNGSAENARLLDRNAIDGGIMASNWVHSALTAEKPFDAKIDLRSVAPLADTPYIFVVKSDSPIRQMSDLRGKRIAVGDRGSGFELNSRAILGAVGITFDDIRPAYLGLQDGAQALRDGRVDSQLFGSIPNPAFLELTELASIRVVTYTDADRETITTKFPWYSKATMRKGFFKGLNNDVPVISGLSALMASPKTDETKVYLMTKALLDNLDSLVKKYPQFSTTPDLLNAAKTDGAKALVVSNAPLHPGAERAYREAGYLK